MKEDSKPVEKTESIQPINEEIQGEQLERNRRRFQPAARSPRHA
jgi:hypothetical protein